jgi:hypothetical protein
MPDEMFIEYNEPTIHGEKVIPEYTVQKYPKNPFNGKTLTRYIIAPTEPTQGKKDALEGLIEELQTVKMCMIANRDKQTGLIQDLIDVEMKIRKHIGGE